jgi:MFS family permease
MDNAIEREVGIHKTKSYDHQEGVDALGEASKGKGNQGNGNQGMNKMDTSRQSSSFDKTDTSRESSNFDNIELLGYFQQLGLLFAVAALAAVCIGVLLGPDLGAVIVAISHLFFFCGILALTVGDVDMNAWFKQERHTAEVLLVSTALLGLFAPPWLHLGVVVYAVVRFDKVLNKEEGYPLATDLLVVFFALLAVSEYMKDILLQISCAHQQHMLIRLTEGYLICNAATYARSALAAVMILAGPAAMYLAYHRAKKDTAVRTTNTDSAGYTAAVTTVTVADGSVFASGDFVGTNEIMKITGITNTNDLEVTRGAAGTTAQDIPTSTPALTKQTITPADVATRATACCYMAIYAYYATLSMYRAMGHLLNGFIYNRWENPILLASPAIVTLLSIGWITTETIQPREDGRINEQQQLHMLHGRFLRLGFLVATVACTIVCIGLTTEQHQVGQALITLGYILFFSGGLVMTLADADLNTWFEQQRCMVMVLGVVTLFFGYFIPPWLHLGVVVYGAVRFDKVLKEVEKREPNRHTVAARSSLGRGSGSSLGRGSGSSLGRGGGTRLAGTGTVTEDSKEVNTTSDLSRKHMLKKSEKWIEETMEGQHIFKMPDYPLATELAVLYVALLAACEGIQAILLHVGCAHKPESNPLMHLAPHISTCQQATYVRSVLAAVLILVGPATIYLAYHRAKNEEDRDESPTVCCYMGCYAWFATVCTYRCLAHLLNFLVYGGETGETNNGVLFLSQAMSSVVSLMFMGCRRQMYDALGDWWIMKATAAAENAMVRSSSIADLLSGLKGDMAGDVAVLLKMVQVIPRLRKLKGWNLLERSSDLKSLTLHGVTQIKGRVTKIDIQARSNWRDRKSSRRNADSCGVGCSISAIPFRDLAALRVLRLSGNHLEGSIDDIHLEDLEQLHVLHLDNNHLTGDLPHQLGTSKCCPHLMSLDVSNNRDVGGGVCMELMQREGVILPFLVQRNGRRIKTPFFVGVSLASETLVELIRQFPPLKKGMRTQKKVDTVSVRSKEFEGYSEFIPEHRCIRKQRGSKEFEGIKGKGFSPWQIVWLSGLENLGREAAECNLKEDAEYPVSVYVVCHAHNPRFKRVFKRKLGGVPGLSREEQEKRHFSDDFDPKFALNGEGASSILDWVSDFSNKQALTATRYL